MKTKYFITTLLLLALSLSSCREITVKTKVNPDGSFTRIVTLTGAVSDSSSVVRKEGLPYPIDESWQSDIRKDTTDSTKLICTYYKTFSKDDELNKMISEDTSWKRQIEREVIISKRFMFFYSFLTYREVYKAANPGNFIDHTAYLSPADMQWVTKSRLPLNREDSVLMEAAEQRALEYLLESAVAEIMYSLDEGLSQLDVPGHQIVDINLYKDSLTKYIEKIWDTPFIFIDSLASWSGNEIFSELAELSPHIFDQYLAKVTFFDDIITMEGFRNEVEMPGLITATNSMQLLGNTVAWDVESMAFFFEDYEMFVESRVVNRWAFVISGIVLILLLIVFVVKIFR